jgi:HAD superfamily hydrolase (TIGR01549 family)
MNPAALVSGAKIVLLDFDGPVCSVFAGRPAPEVAEHLREMIRQHGYSVPAHITHETDPMVVLEFAGSLDERLVASVDIALRAAELDAVRVASPTPGSAEFIRHTATEHRTVIVVSNNSTEAIEAYLAAHDLSTSVAGIVGRAIARPDLMKPHPWSLTMALKHGGPAGAVYIGDSVSDVEAGRAAGVTVIGYANKPGKDTTLTHAGADAIVHDMHELITS